VIPEEVRAWLVENGHGTVIASRGVGGGCINAGTILTTGTGLTFFLKSNRQAPADMFEREAQGLESLAVPDGPRIPRPYLHGTHFLLLENLAPGPRREDYWPSFGRQLAALHENTSSRFGFQHDNYIGSTPQPNPWTEDGYEFFAERRLSFQARLAQKQGYLEPEGVRQVERLAERLPELIPKQVASLVHGDLWSGNAMVDAAGNPAIIDPAAHFGWAEAELAMTTLFGVFPEGFYRAYSEVRLLEPGYQERYPIYNLYHLLNHLNLFGRGYLGEVLSSLRRFG
jgi:fructosamine-3-kinase